MSDGRRNNPRFLHSKDRKRSTNPSKNRTDRSTELIELQPKILQKPKEKPATPTPAIIQQPAPIQISIATREPTQPSSTSSTSAVIKPCNVKSTENEPNGRTAEMVSSCPLITEHYQVNQQAFDYLCNGNADYQVIGIVGPQGVGKSTIMNCLAEQFRRDSNFDETLIREKFNEGHGPFLTRSREQQFLFKNLPATEGIQMYITRCRQILLDCSPILCNPYRKNFLNSEIDDLKQLIFLLNICHLIVVVQEDMLNLALVRLLRCAESMKLINPNDDDVHYPKILFIHNRIELMDHTDGETNRLSNFYKLFFNKSKLPIFTKMVRKSNDADNLKLNYIMLPVFSANEAKDDLNRYISDMIKEIRELSYTSAQCNFTEKLWSQLVQSAWESNKNNYFLRKYENLKDKDWNIR